MKILIFSDSHGNVLNIKKAVEAHGGRADLIIHLGDGSRDLDIIEKMYPDIPVSKIAGNYEEFSTSFSMRGSLVFEKIYDIEGIRIFASHGHKYNVKTGLGGLINAGISRNADLVLFGHTHIPEEHSVKINENDPDSGYIRIFNPGSIGRGSEYTYGVIEIVNGKILTGFGRT